MIVCVCLNLKYRFICLVPIKYIQIELRGVEMQLNEYMKDKFPNLELRPPLFYSWDIGIRFELGVEWKSEYDYPNSPYLLGCYKRAITLFEALHSPTDDIFIVVDVNDYDKGKNIKRKLKNFSPMLRNHYCIN